MRTRIEELAAQGAFPELRRVLALTDRDALARAWPKLGALQKLVAFKLMDAAMALDFYGRLSFPDKYFLLCGFPVNSIAPVLEGLPSGARRLFVQLPADFYGIMFRQLDAGRSGHAG